MRKSYKTALLIALILFLACSIFATAVWDDEIRAAKAKVEQDPGNSEFRLQLAWYYMMAAQLENAEMHYRIITENAPQELGAWEGLAWSMAEQGKVSASKALLSGLKAKYPANAGFQNLYAYTLMLQKRYPSALKYYKTGKNLAMMDPIQKDIATKGLGWSYASLGDKANSDKWYSLTDIKPDNITFGSSMFYGSTDADKFFLGYSQSASLFTWKVGATYEEYYIDSDMYRNRISGYLAKQFKPLDIKISALQLSSDDEVYYPAQNLSLQISPKLYFQGMLLKPNVMVAATRYPRFDNQQISFNPVLYIADMDLSYALHYGFLDSEYPDADEAEIVHNLALHKKLPFALEAGVYYSIGNDSWQAGSTGSLTDNPENADSYMAASLSYSPLSWLGLYAYYQSGAARDLIYSSISIKY